MNSFADSREECLENRIGFVHSTGRREARGEGRGDPNQFFVGIEIRKGSFACECVQLMHRWIVEKRFSKENDDILLFDPGEKTRRSKRLTKRLILVEKSDGGMNIDVFHSTDRCGEFHQRFSGEANRRTAKKNVTGRRRGEDANEIDQLTTRARNQREVLLQPCRTRLQSKTNLFERRLLILIAEILSFVDHFAVHRKNLFREECPFGQFSLDLFLIGQLRRIFDLRQADQLAERNDRPVESGHRGSIGDETQFEFHLFLRLGRRHQRRIHFILTADDVKFDFTAEVRDDRFKEKFSEEKSI